MIKMYKKLISLFLVLSMMIFLSSCSTKKVVKVEDIKFTVEDMNFEDLVKNAVKESNGKKIVVKSALPRVDEALDDFFEYLIKYDGEYDIDIEYEDLDEEEIFNIIDSEKKSKDSVSVIITKNKSLFKELKEKNKIITYVPIDYRKANNISKEDAPIDMPLLTKYSPIFTEDDELKDLDNIWKFLFYDDNTFNINIYEDEYDTFLDNMLIDKNVSALEEAYEALTSEEKEKINTIFEESNLSLINTSLSESDAFKNMLNVVDFSLLIDKKITQSEDLDGSSVVFANNPNFKGTTGYMNDYYIYACANSPYPYTTLCFISFVTSVFDGFKALSNEPYFYTTNELINDEIMEYYYNDRLSDEIVDRGLKYYKNSKNTIIKDEDKLEALHKELDKIDGSGGVG